MGYGAKILLDSVAPCGKRLTTYQLDMPKFLQAEFNTHRVLSRNSASSRAIPSQKIIQRVIDDPVKPIWFGKIQPGMQAREELAAETAQACWDEIRELRNHAVQAVRNLLAMGLHKQVANRYLEPWMFTSIIASGTDWSGFFRLRDHPDAQPEFRVVAHEAHELYKVSVPKTLLANEWHTPLIQDDELGDMRRWWIDHDVSGDHPEADFQTCVNRISAGRCARVSYLTHEGKRDFGEDLALYHKLVSGEPQHSSPLEHVARALSARKRVGNFVGWRQLRADVDRHFVHVREEETSVSDEGVQ